jgi:hypothetical protein
LFAKRAGEQLANNSARPMKSRLREARRKLYSPISREKNLPGEEVLNW